MRSNNSLRRNGKYRRSMRQILGFNFYCEGTRNIEVGTRNIKLTTLDKGRQRLILARWKHDK